MQIMFEKELYNLKMKLKKFLIKKNDNDDFDWCLYSEHYRGELNEISNKHTLILKPDDYIYLNRNLKKNKAILPLHPNHRLLYETILQLSPQSLIELGCGGGDHLSNISVLNSKINLFGVDLSEKQIGLLYTRHPKLNAHIRTLDITLPHPLNSPVVDIAYTQAVIMHLHTGNNFLIALANLFSYAKKQIILMENWKSHNFMENVYFLYENKMINWHKLFFYYRESEELKRPHIMVISAEPLQYNELTDYNILVNAMDN